MLLQEGEDTPIGIIALCVSATEAHCLAFEHPFLIFSSSNKAVVSVWVDVRLIVGLPFPHTILIPRHAEIGGNCRVLGTTQE